MTIHPGWAAKAAEYFTIGYDRWPKVYFIGTKLDEPIKIGRAVNVAKRKCGIQTGNPNKLRVFASTPEGSIINENRLHEGFCDARLIGEWFRPVPTIISIIEDLKAGNRLRVAERLHGEKIDLDWMASMVYAEEKGKPDKSDLADWLRTLSDDDIKRIVKIKSRMPL